MNIALQLLISAMTLLTMVNSNSNLPQSFRDSAIQIANTAVSYAQQVIANGGSKEGVQVPPITINPVVTAVGTVSEPVTPSVSCEDVLSLMDSSPITEVQVQRPMYGGSSRGPLSISATYTIGLKDTCENRHWFVDVTTPDKDQSFLNVPLPYNGKQDARVGGLFTYVRPANINVGQYIQYQATSSIIDVPITVFYHSPDTEVSLTKNYTAHFDMCVYENYPDQVKDYYNCK